MLKDITVLMPNFTLPNTRLLREVVKSTMPVPLSETLCDPVPPLSVRVSFALRAPVALGVNATPSVQDDLGATVTGIAPQVPAPLMAYSAGSDDFALEITSGLVLPVLVTVRFFATVWPTATFPNASEPVTDIDVVGVAVGVTVAVAVGVAVGVRVSVGVPIAVGVGVGVAVAVGVPVGVTVAVAVALGVSVGVPVAVAVALAVSVGVPVAVAVGVSVGVPVAVAVALAVSVGVPVAVAVVVAVSVGVPVAVAVPVVVGVGVGTA